MSLDPTIINHRFKELMQRDPLVAKASSQYRKFLQRSPGTAEGIIKLPQELKVLLSEITSKWNVATFEINISTGDFQVQKVAPVVEGCAPWQKIDSQGEEQFFIWGPDKFYVSIDLSCIDLNDARQVKKQIWDLVKTRLAERKSSRPETSKWNPAKPRNDAPELGFVYHTRQDKFEKYLRWYDWHYTKVSLRLIAWLEEKAGSEGLKSLPDQVTWAKKLPRLGISIRGEDAVQKGVEKIYLAIHRARFVPVEPMLDLHDCPDHGNECPGPKLCAYSEKWINRFNRLFRST